MISLSKEKALQLKKKLNKLMDTQNFTATILLDSSASRAFEAIQNFRGWWSEDIEGETNRLNDTFFYHYKDVHMCKIKLIEKITDFRLTYHVLDNQFSFTKDKTEWVDTKLMFEISKEGDRTKVKFTHNGLTPLDECYEICNDSWSNYIKKSLYDLITKGKGQPNPIEDGGFNAAIVEKWKLN